MLTREMKSRLFVGIVWFCLTMSSAVLVGLISLIFIKGLPAINLSFLTARASDFGASGGIGFQIIGSVIMVALAGLIAFTLSLGLALFISEILTGDKAQKRALSVLLTLNTVPSITFGIFGLIFFVYILGTGISWSVGAVILAFMMLPTVTLSTYQTINAIPTIYRENAYALGFNLNQTIRHVIIPQGLHGAISGLLIGLARAIGETAPIMFVATAFSGVGVPGGLHEPVATLPTHILALAQQATNPQALQNSWGAALVLMTIVMIFSLTGLIFRARQNKDVAA